MRLILAATLSFLLVGGTYFYIAFAENVRPPKIELNVTLDEGEWTLIVDRTFVCVPDPDLDISSLLVKFKDQELFQTREKIPAEQSIHIKPIRGVELGRNQIYVEANLAAVNDFEFDSSQLSHAMRLTVLRGQKVIKEKTTWLVRGDTSLVTSISFEVSIPDDIND